MVRAEYQHAHMTKVLGLRNGRLGNDAITPFLLGAVEDRSGALQRRIASIIEA